MLLKLLTTTLLLVSVSSLTMAVDDELEPDPAIKETVKKADKKIDKNTKQDKFKVFKPSEEISEDLSVPFPTDI